MGGALELCLAAVATCVDGGDGWSGGLDVGEDMVVEELVDECTIMLGGRSTQEGGEEWVERI